MNWILLSKITTIFINIFGFWLAFWIYTVNRKSKVNQIFFAMVILILLWVNFAYLSYVQLHRVLFWQKLLYLTVTFWFIPAYFFSIYFPKPGKRYLILEKFIIFLILLFCYLIGFTNLIIKGVEIEKWAIIKYGSGSIFYHIFILFLVFLILFNLFKKYFSLSKEDKLRVQYFLIGSTIFAFLNIVFNIIFMYGSLQKYSNFFGVNLSTVFLLIFTSLAIVKRELFGIKIILVDLLVSVVGIVLFIFPFFLPTLIFKIISWSIFWLFCIFGYLLIQYTHREVRQKEILEEKVQERTKELETAKDIAEGRAKEIEKRKEDLEKFYKLTVGRELRMIELKKQIKELEEKTKRESQ